MEDCRGPSGGSGDRGGSPGPWRKVAAGRRAGVVIAESCRAGRGELPQHGALSALSRGQSSALRQLSAAWTASFRVRRNLHVVAVQGLRVPPDERRVFLLSYRASARRQTTPKS